MSLFNRVVVIVLAFGVLALSMAVWLLPQVVLARLDASVSMLRRAPEVSFFVVGVIGATVALVVLVLELWPHPSPRVFRVRFDGGTLRYPAVGVANLVERDVARMDGISRAKVSLRHRRGKLDVFAWLTTTEADDPKTIASAGAGRMRDKLERGLGLPVREMCLSVQPGEPAGAARERERARALAAPTTSGSPSIM